MSTGNRTLTATIPGRARKTGLLLGGGAPNSTLIAGALAAFVEEGIEFDVISASGAGVLMGLLYTAPHDATPRQALQSWADTGVADSIYKMIPINYKIFQKPGVQASTFRDAFQPPANNPFFRRSSKRLRGRRARGRTGAS